MLTEVLYNQQRQEHASLELDPTKFVSMIEATNPQLKGFFNYMTNAIIPKEHSAYNINEARKSIVGLCYMIAGLHNKFVNQHKLEVGLYLMASGATWEAVDTMSSLGYADNIKERKEERSTKRLQLVGLKEQSLHSVQDYVKEHLTCFTEYFVENVHSKIRANTSQNATVDNIIKQAYRKKLPEIYHLATLNEDVDLRRLPTGYSTAHPPHPEFCDKCGLPFTDNNGSNGLRRELIHLPRRTDEDDVENVEENSGEIETIDILASLAAQIEQIKYW
ncbi:hypothetical protein C2G38_2176874 [Gigaspora rosea]|uniref:Uncharacterized protein n=1 Tax=Gigaspora rosea TaxID=44941 RepID=A0A397VK35_9GLOM|nr:hypothetical protein C2G38_2176874 [Gigaspora rosea]